MQSIGFIGLGVMGQPMALHLVSEYPLVVFNRTPMRMEPLLEKGASRAPTAEALAQTCSTIFLMVKNDQALAEVVEGPKGVLAGLRPGTLLVDHSTVSPDITRRLAAKVWEKGSEWIDAPVTGGDIGARQATLTIMVGGRVEAFRRAQPFLQRLGRHIIHVGEVGQGQTLKVVANLVSAINLMAAAEGLAMGLAQGLSLSDLATVMQTGSAQSFELGKLLERISEHRFNPGFSVENRYKDLKLAWDLAIQQGFPPALAKVAEELYRQHYQAGFGAEDESSYIKRWTESE